MELRRRWNAANRASEYEYYTPTRRPKEPDFTSMVQGNPIANVVAVHKNLEELGIDPVIHVCGTIGWFAGFGFGGVVGSMAGGAIGGLVGIAITAVQESCGCKKIQ